MAALASVDEAEFGTLTAHLAVSDSVLSKNMTKLEEAGMLEVRKGYIGRRPRTWLTLSRSGRTALSKYQGALSELLEGLDGTGAPTN